MDQRSDGIVAADEQETVCQPDTEELETGLHVTIASFGVGGITAAGLLAQSHYLKDGGYDRDTVSFIQLDASIAAEEMHAIVASSDLIFILGSDDGITAPPSALSLARICRENDILCYTILMATTSWQQADVATKNLCSLSSNVFRMPFTRPVNNPVSCSRMKDATLNIINPLFGVGIICVDFADISTVLRCGQTTHFASGIASGAQRAKEAARSAMLQLPDIAAIRGIICNITGGMDLTMDDFEKTGDEIHSAVAEDATVVISTTLDPEMDGITNVGVTAVYYSLQPVD